MRSPKNCTALFAVVCSLAACQDYATTPRLDPAGSSVNRSFPVIIPPSTDFVGISAGQNQTCARQFGGNLYCWGDNSYGQIGTGASDPTHCQAYDPCVVAPTYVMGALQVAAGAGHTCALDFG